MLSNSDLEFLIKLESIIEDRIENPAGKSYTSSLIAQGPSRVAQKVGEEGVELALAAVSENREEILSEAADLVYHLLVMLHGQELCFTDVVATLEARHTG